MAFVEQAILAKRQRVTEFLSKQNVVGLGVGFKNRLGADDGDGSVVVLVQRKKPLEALRDEDIIPSEVDGVPTDVVEIGTLRAQRSPRERFRPVIQPGASIAHFRVGAGTLGAVLRRRGSGETVLLSNNHVLANSNDAQAGDAILQPGPLDGGRRPADTVATLAEFRSLSYLEDATAPDPTPQPPTPAPPTAPDNPPPSDSGCDIVEAAVAAANVLAQAAGSTKRVQSVGEDAGAQSAGTTGGPSSTINAQAANAENLMDVALATPQDPAMFSPEILQIGGIQGIKAPKLGMTVAKMGRTTGYTEGKITLLDATVNVQYDTMDGLKTARFVDQVITSGMSSNGDSGSLIIDPADDFAVGLLFGGSDVASIFTPIQVILDAFELEF